MKLKLKIKWIILIILALAITALGVISILNFLNTREKSDMTLENNTNNVIEIELKNTKYFKDNIKDLTTGLGKYKYNTFDSFFKNDSDWYVYNQYRVTTNFEHTDLNDSINYKDILIRFNNESDIVDLGIHTVVDEQNLYNMMIRDLEIIRELFNNDISTEAEVILAEAKEGDMIKSNFDTSKGILEISYTINRTSIPRTVYVPNKNEAKLIKEYIEKMEKSGRKDVDNLKEESKEMFGEYETKSFDKMSYTIGLKLINEDVVTKVEDLNYPIEFKEVLNNILSNNKNNLLDSVNYQPIVYMIKADSISIDKIDVSDNINIKGFININESKQNIEIIVEEDRLNIDYNTNYFNTLTECLNYYNNLISLVLDSEFNKDFEKEIDDIDKSLLSGNTEKLEYEDSSNIVTSTIEYSMNEGYRLINHIEKVYQSQSNELNEDK